MATKWTKFHLQLLLLSLTGTKDSAVVQ